MHLVGDKFMEVLEDLDIIVLLVVGWPFFQLVNKLLIDASFFQHIHQISVKVLLVINALDQFKVIITMLFNYEPQQLEPELKVTYYKTEIISDI